MSLLKEGYQLVLVDNLSRRDIDVKYGLSSLTNIAKFDKRIEAAKEVISKEIISYEFDISQNSNKIKELINTHKIDVIVHFAEQRSAPFSMIGSDERQYTINNNIQTTHNVCSAIIDSDRAVHLVHLGTMGVYGYNDTFGDIPEGYLNVVAKNQGAKDIEKEILYPTAPGSIYHLTKSLDQLIFDFYNRNWGLKVTDLHQGIVWGTQTPETNQSRSFEPFRL